MRLEQEIRDTYYHVSPKNQGHLAYVDLMRASALFGEIFQASVMDIGARYRRSILGPLWLVIGQVSFALGFAVLGTFIFKTDLEFYLLYIFSGVMAWQLILGCLQDGTSMYLSATTELMTRRESFSAFAVRVVLRQLIVLAHSIPVLLFASIYAGRFTWDVLWVIPGLAVVCFAMLPLVLLCGIIATKMRDFAQFVVVSLQFVVYITPIFWLESLVPDGAARILVDGNPFYHMAALIREPFLADPPAMIHWIGVGVTGSIAWTLAAIMFPSARGKINYWL